MHKLSYYLDTSIFNFLISGDEPSKTITRELMGALSKIGEVYVSEVVIREVNAAPEPKKSQLVSEINTYSPKLLEVGLEVQELANKYVSEGIIPEKYYDDALHIAIAVVYNLDVIVSWNFEHIVKLKTRREVNGLNIMLGYKEIEICSPEEAL